jgi:LL-diaminopimelate aminotransferase
MEILAADRVRTLPPYLFAAIDRMKAEARERGADLIDLGIGDPDLPTPPHLVQALQRAAGNPEYHRYPSYEGMLRTRQAATDFYRRRFGVELDPASQALTLIGSKEGLAHLPLALINPGDLALVPDPAYPVYDTTVKFAGGEVYRYPLPAEHDFLPDLESLPAEVAQRAKLLVINYPNNPTGAVATLDDYRRILEFAQRHRLMVVSDLAYSEMFFEPPAPPSFLQLPGAAERTLEFYSLSKTYNMTGWRVGFALGQPQMVAALGKIKTNVDSGVFGAIQEVAMAALSGDQACVEQMRSTYRERRDLLLQGLQRAGLTCLNPRATFYVWTRVPEGQSSMDFCARLLREAGLVVTPGNGFGERGEGYVRFALTVGETRIAEAAERLGGLSL